MIRLKEVMKDGASQGLSEALAILWLEFGTERRMYCCRF